MKYLLYMIIGGILFVGITPIEDALSVLKNRAKADNDEDDLKLAQKAEWVAGIYITALFLCISYILAKCMEQICFHTKVIDIKVVLFIIINRARNSTEAAHTRQMCFFVRFIF